jgi:hypothetical protein
MSYEQARRRTVIRDAIRVQAASSPAPPVAAAHIMNVKRVMADRTAQSEKLRHPQYALYIYAFRKKSNRSAF